MFFCRVKQLAALLLLLYATLNSFILYICIYIHIHTQTSTNTVFSYRTRSYEHNINKIAALDRIMLMAKFVYMCVFQKRFSSPPEYSESLGCTWRIIKVRRTFVADENVRTLSRFTDVCLAYFS